MRVTAKLRASVPIDTMGYTHALLGEGGADPQMAFTSLCVSLQEPFDALVAELQKRMQENAEDANMHATPVHYKPYLRETAEGIKLSLTLTVAMRPKKLALKLVKP